ncbi:MAG TPA: prepilin-type N-terminal cleavage/methylation domain-containing protein [Burkholderiales bacterium]|nr:prepilin-type N-terminal cleavage/methylation domain-containing protein [Burkholderiales bacterium]
MQPSAVSRQSSASTAWRLAAGRWRLAAYRRRGFTLIELLIVITILALGAMAVALSVSGSDARMLKEETARLGALFRIAQDEARISGRALVWEADLEGYRFEPLDPEAARGWKDEILRPRAWPFTVRRIEGGRIVFGREPLLDPGTLRIVTADREVLLVLDALGELRLHE